MTVVKHDITVQGIIPVPAHSKEEAIELVKKMHSDKANLEVIECYDARENPREMQEMDEPEFDVENVIEEVVKKRTIN